MALMILKQLLIDLNYPNINILTLEEVADVFNSTNRLFFLTWAVNQLGIDNLSIENCIAEKQLIQLMTDFGFCSNSQNVDFVKGNSQLGLEESLVIIERILNFLNQIKIPTPTPLFGFTLTGEELKQFTEMDINLFPSVGPIKQFKSFRENENVEEIDKEINLLQSDIKSLEEELGQDWRPIIITIEPDFIYFKDVMTQMELVNRSLRTIAKQPLSNNLFKSIFPEIMENCYKCITVISQNMTNVFNIVNFKNDVFVNKINEDIDDLKYVIEKISKISNGLM